MGMRMILSAVFSFWAAAQVVFAAPRCKFLELGKGRTVDFPNIEKLEIESYQLTVEYTVPGATQTDYYVEYYDMVDRRGKVDVHQASKASSYMYRTASLEAWEISGNDCKLTNISTTPEMLKDYETDWKHVPGDDFKKATIGPSAMFKIALDTWNSKSDDMAYMGVYESDVRGVEAQYWRRCNSDNTYVDYFFSTTNDESAFGHLTIKLSPLRVTFAGDDAADSNLSVQQYEILTYQPFISVDEAPFELPKGKGCKRVQELEDAPELPDFSNKNLMFSAEVIYRKIDRSGEDAQYTSYYSTLKYALDLQSEHVAYYYTPWDSSGKSDKPSDVGSPEYIIFDTKHKYAYKTSLETASCEIIREKDFSPVYVLPENGGEIALDDPYILFPNNELSYLTKGSNRGLKVNIFEAIVPGYVINKNNQETQIDRAIISHSYLQDDEIERNVGSVKNALVQVQMVLRRDKDAKIIELLVFNFFGFTTQLRNRRSLFNIKRCFKNDDDYLWATIGFNADASQLAKIRDDAPSIQANILNLITLKSELNPVRIPIIMVDINDGVFVSMLILNKPPVLLDFLELEEGSVVIGSKDVEGIQNPMVCANSCLETEDGCWGFSMCGAVCTYGVDKAQVGKKTGCQLYRRFNNASFIPSSEMMMTNLRREVESQEVKLMLRDKDDNMIELQANSIQIVEPGEDDRLFDQIGNTLNPRMRVLKAGYRLKPIAGNPVKNLGRVRYDECQRICLDFKQCETVSYCLRDSECLVSSKYGDDLAADVVEEDNMCNLVTRKYGDHFDRSPGNVLVETAQEELDLKTTEECARACLKSDKFTCLSFDHCPADESKGCKLHTVHYPKPETREAKTVKSTNCGHYFRRFSTEFKKNPEKRSVGAKLPPLTNLTLEECAKDCVEYGQGTCYGFDFCQDGTLLSTSCQLLDESSPKTTYSPICNNFQRLAAGLSQSRPYSSGYAGGIGFLCFMVGLLAGAAVVFTIAYLRVNRR